MRLHCSGPYFFPETKDATKPDERAGGDRVERLALPGHAEPFYAVNKLIYNANDGSLTIDTNGENLGGYVIELDQDVFVGPFVTTDPPANPINLTVNANQVSLFQFTNSRVGFSWYLSETNTPGGPEVNGVFNIGPVVQPGLTEAQFFDAFTSNNGARYIGTLGGGVFDDFELQYVAATPEPTSLALLGLGGLLVARRRRG